MITRLNGLIKDKQNRTSLFFIIDGALINAALILTSGVFLSGYIVLLGGSDFLVGLLNNSLTWASIASLFSFMIFERLARRKRFLLTLLVTSRLLVCSTIFLPLIFGKSPATLGLLTVMVIVGNMLWGIYGVGFSVWLMTSFPRESRNSFVFQRVFWLRITFTLFTIAMGYVLDWSGKSYGGFLIVFLTSLVLSLIDGAILLKVKDVHQPVNEKARFNFTIFFEPLHQKAYRGFLIFIFLFYLSLTISSSFTPLYLIRYLKFDYKFISVSNVVAYLFMIVCTKLWSRLEHKVGLMTVFKITGLVAIFEMLVYGFLTNDTYYLLYLASAFAGIGYSGFNIFVFNYRYELMPENDRTIYEGWFGAILGLSMLLGPTLGNLVMNQLPVLQDEFFQHSKFQLMYFISFFLAAATLLLVFRRRNRKQV